jgi:hypothetical protein
MSLHRHQLLGLLASYADPLTRLVVADQLASELRVLLRELALEAHDAGYTWDDIGRALGVSRACVHERFSPRNTRAAARTRRSR